MVWSLVNNLAGGHAGPRAPEALLRELEPFGVPVVAADGVGDGAAFRQMLDLGYAAVQCGTRFIATTECTASEPYKAAIVRSRASDIVLSERITGVPVSVINTPWIQHMGLKAGPITRRLLQGRKTRHAMRTLFALKSLWQLKRASLDESGNKDYWQAGKSVEGIERVESVADVVAEFGTAIG